MVDINHVIHGNKSQMHIKMDTVITSKINIRNFNELKLILEDPKYLTPKETKKASEIIKSEITGNFISAANGELGRMKVDQRWRNMKSRRRKKYKHLWN